VLGKKGKRLTGGDKVERLESFSQRSVEERRRKPASRWGGAEMGGGIREVGDLQGEGGASALGSGPCRPERQNTAEEQSIRHVFQQHERFTGK